MQVNLAGYNVDATVLQELEKKIGKRNDLTPEVISAAYARISRDSRSISEIRKDARCEVERSRKSNSTIIFKMGHHSIAEHAVFNFDIIGVSRFAMEEVEKFRLCSYTEKSQRYITLDNDFVVPEEIAGTALSDLFLDTIKEQNRVYHILFDELKRYVFSKHADLAADPKNHNLLEGWAKEDARYITALATESQVGITVNARNLELMLRRFASSPLGELQQLGRHIYDLVVNVAPSIVLFHQENDRDKKTYSDLKKIVADLIKRDANSYSNNAIPDIVSLVDYVKDADKIIAAALLHSSSSFSYQECFNSVEQLPKEDLENIFKNSFRHMQFYDSMLREFEYANFTFNIVLSAACFGQIKRHRMSTIATQTYDPELSVTIPDSIKEIGMQGYFEKVIRRTNQVYYEINKKAPLVAPYILTNAHRRRVLMRVNARELYHMSRLREDAHAQWDIQNVVREMSAQAKEVMPMTFALIGGKDKYNSLYEKLYGQKPQVIEAVLPGSRKIK